MSDRKPTDYELMQKLARQMAKERLEREKAARRMAEKATPPQAADSTRSASDQTTVIHKDDLRRASSGSRPAVPNRPTPSGNSSRRDIEQFDDITAFEQEFMGGGKNKHAAETSASPETDGKKKFSFSRKKKDAGSKMPAPKRPRPDAKAGSLKEKFYNFRDAHPKFDAFIYDLNPNNWVDKNGNPLSRRKKIFKFGRRTVATLVSLGILYSAVVIITAPSIDPKNIYDAMSTDSIVYDDNGDAVDSVSSGQKRTIIKYKQLPKNMVNAIVALEDKTFWDHHGFNWKRMVGAVLQSLTGGGGISGTSTLTQQLARNVYLPDIMSQRSLRRKIIEMWYAARIEHALSKEEIVTAYLNSIYYGYGNYGIEAASEC